MKQHNISWGDRLISVLCVVALLFNMMPVTVFAEDTATRTPAGGVVVIVKDGETAVSNASVAYFVKASASSPTDTVTTNSEGKATIPGEIEVSRIEVSCAGYLPEKQIYNYSGESELKALLTKSVDISSITDTVSEYTLYFNTDEQKSVLLTPVAEPSNHTENIVWSSGNNRIAVVENGTVTAVAKGNTTITAAAENHPDVKYIYNIYVKKGVLGIDLDKANLEMEPGKQRKLRAKVSPWDADDTEIVWSSDNSNVATVENGMVTAIGNGTAHITAECNGQKAVCTVSVITPATGVIIVNQPTGSLTYGDTHQLNAQVTPPTSTDAVVWSVQSGKAVEVDPSTGKLTAVNVGDAVVRATAGSVTSECTITVVPRVVKVTGVALNDKEYDGTTRVDSALPGVFSFDNKLEADTLKVIGAVYGDTASANASETVHTVSVDLSGAQLDNANYELDTAQNSAQATVKIVKKQLAAAALTANNNQAPSYTAQSSYADLKLTLNGIVEADSDLNNTLMGVTASGTNKLLVSPEGAEVTLDYGSQDLSAYANYVLPQNANLILNPIELKATVIGKEKEYDGTTLAKEQFEAVLSGVLPSDIVTPVVTDSAYLDANVAAAVPVTAKVALTGADAQNYILPETAITFEDGSIVKTSEMVSLTVEVAPSVADPDTRLSVNIWAKGQAGKEILLNGTAIVSYKTKNDTATQTVEVKNGTGSCEIDAVPGEQSVKVTFTVSDAEESYVGTHKATAKYNEGYKVQELTGTAVSAVEYGTPQQFEIKAVDKETQKETGAEIVYESGNNAAAVIDKNGVIHVRDVEAAKADGYKVPITAYAKSVKGAYNASYKQTYMVKLMKKEVTPSISCSGKVFDGTDQGLVEYSLEGVIPQDKDVVLSNNGVDGKVKATFSGKNVSEEEYTVTAENLTLIGKTAEGAAAANNYSLTTTKAVTKAKITPKNISDQELALALDADGVMYYTGTNREPQETVNVDLDGDSVKETTLIPNTDYTITYANQKDIGEATATVTGQGNYEGSIQRTYTIAYKPADPHAELLFITGNNGGKPVERKAYPKDAEKNQWWYNSQITVASAAGYTFDDVKPTAGSALKVSKSYGAEDGWNILGDTRFYVRENATGMISRITVGDIINIDKTAPVLTSIETSTQGETYPEGHYYKEGFTTTFTVEEENYNRTEGNSAFTVSVGTNAASSNNSVLANVSTDTNDKTKITVNVDPKDAVISGEDHTPYLEITDPAGNKLVASTASVTCTDGKAVDKEKRILDTKAPEVVISYSDLDDRHYYDTVAYYNKELTAFFAFTDENGIDCKKVHKVVDVTEGSAFASIDAAPQDAQDTIVVEALDKNNGHYQFSAYGTDKAGNALTVKEMQTAAGNPQAVVTTGVASKTVGAYHKILDTIGPLAKIKIDAGNALRKELQKAYNNRYYFNDDFTMTVTITDDNYDHDKIEIRTGQQIGSDFELSSQEVSPENPVNGVFADGVCTYKMTSAGEGVYVLDGKGVDRAGNSIELSGGELANSVQTVIPDSIESSGEAADRFVTYVIAVDKTVPVLNISMKDGNNNENGFNPETGNFYEAVLSRDGYQLQTNWPYRSSKTADFSFAATDQAPVTVLYQIESNAPNSSFGYELTGAADMIGNAGEAPAGAYQNALANTRAVVENEQILQIGSLLAEDLAGNKVSYSKSENENKIYLDVKAPTDDNLQPVVRLSVPKSAASNTLSHRPISGAALYNGKVEILVDIMDPYTQANAKAPASGSGLKRVYYKVTVDGVSNEQITNAVGLSTKSGLTATADPNQAGVYYIDYGTAGQSGQVEHNEKLTSADQLKLVFDPNTAGGIFNFNSIELEVWGIDNANNGIAMENRASYAFGIDVTAPEITVSYDNNSAQNEIYFNASRTATVTVTERNFDPSRINIRTESGAISGWDYVPGDAANGDKDQWSCTITYAADGVYTLNISGTDQLGNNASSIVYNGTAPQNFVIDKTAPTVNIDFDNNDVRNGKYYNRARTASVTVNDVNFSGENDIQVNAAAGGSAPVVAFSGTTAVLAFTADGTYDFHGTVTDLAGNQSQEFSVDEFVIDQTAPELRIEGVEEHAAYADAVQPSVVFSDLNYDSNHVSLVRTGLNQKNVDVTDLLAAQGGVTADANGIANGTIHYADLEHIKENDGLYTINASVVDLAGNTTEVAVTYSVNRFGTVYVYSDTLNGMIGQYKQAADKELYITAYNVTPLIADSAILQITCDGAMLQNQNSKVELTDHPQVGASGWYEYRFNINNADLNANGRYEITISDLDETGNTNTNAENPIWFYIDTTKPALDSVIGLENDIVNADSQNVRFVISDAIALDSVKIYVNDEEVQSCDEFAESVYENSFEVSSGLRQKIRFVVKDKAGNVLDTDEETFAPSYPFNKELTVSTNLFIRLYANTPLFWGLIVAIVVFCGGIIAFIFVRKRKKQEETES